MIIKTFDTTLDIAGFEYPVLVEYTKDSEGIIAIYEISIREDGHKELFPYLKDVDNLIVEQIEEYEKYELD